MKAVRRNVTSVTCRGVPEVTLHLRELVAERVLVGGARPLHNKNGVTGNVVSETKDLVEVLQRAGPRTASIAARAARPWRSRRKRRLARTSALRRHSEYRELGLQFLTLALGTLGFLFAENQGLELVLAFFADVLEDGHGKTPKRIAVFYLKSKCGHSANTGRDATLHRTPLVARRPCANACQFSDPATFARARARGTVD